MSDVTHYDPLDPEVVECPFSFYRKLREAGGVYQVPDRGFVLVGSYELAMQVFKDPRTFSSKAGVGVPQGESGQHRIEEGAVHTLLTADPPEHRRYRELVNKAFSLKRIQAWKNDVRGIVDELIDGFVAQKECELLYDFAVPLPLIVICDALGLPRDRLRQFKQWSDGISRLGGLTTPEQKVRIAEESAEFNQYLREMIITRQRNPGDDFVSDLIKAKYDGERELEIPELISIVSQFLVAGNETTTNTIASGMWLLCQHPERLEELQRDHSLIPNFIEETLRMESPVQAHFRLATRDTTLGGVEIPEGTGVGVVFGCANRDEAEFPNPADFDIRRSNARFHLAFGQGIHFCPGAPLARMESALAFERLIERLADIRIVERKSDLTHVPSFTHRGLRKLTIAFDQKIGSHTVQ